MSTSLQTTVLHEVLEREGVTFPVRYCMGCHKEVMVYSRLGEGVRASEVLYHCLFCDQETLQEDDREEPEQDLKALQTLGYTLVDPGELDSGGGGCGSGGGGCGSGGGCHT